MNNDPNRPRNAGENGPPEPRRDQCDVGGGRHETAQRVDAAQAPTREQSTAGTTGTARPAEVTAAQKKGQPEAPPPAEMGPPEGPGA
jgi:hypothetical protein